MEFKTTVYIKPDLIEKIISDYIKKEYDKEVKSFSFSIKRKSEGFGMSERDVAYFDGARAVLE